MSYPATPSFGTMIRAARLGWGLASAHGCFIRMSDADGMNTRIELCPLHEVPREKPKGSYRVWWKNGREILNGLPWLKPIRAIKRYVAVVIDEHGVIVEGR